MVVASSEKFKDFFVTEKAAAFDLRCRAKCIHFKRIKATWKPFNLHHHGNVCRLVFFLGASACVAPYWIYIKTFHKNNDSTTQIKIRKYHQTVDEFHTHTRTQREIRQKNSVLIFGANFNWKYLLRYIKEFQASIININGNQISRFWIN